MAFMSFNAFLYARNDLNFLEIKDLKTTKSGKYSIYEFKKLDMIFTYQSIQAGLLNENDEVAISNQKQKIILLKNFTQNTNNFKEANIRHLLLVLILICASACFGTLCVINGFLNIDITLLMVFSLLLVLSLINYGLLRKQIRILEHLSKEELLNFLNQNS